MFVSITSLFREHRAKASGEGSSKSMTFIGEKKVGTVVMKPIHQKKNLPKLKS